MTTYQITSSAHGVSIELRGVGDSQQQLLAAFGDCQRGRCSCPTTEYEKVEVFDLEATEDGIAIQLRAKSGQEFDTREIATCLDHTVASTDSADS